MKIEHELAERPLEPGERAAQHNEARPGHPAGARKIHQAEPLADRLVRQRLEVESGRLAMMAQHPIRGLVRTVRYVVSRQIRQSGQYLVDLGAQPPRLRGFLCLSLPGRPLRAYERLDLEALKLGGPNLPGKLIAPGLRLLGAGLGGAPRRGRARGSLRRAPVNRAG